MFQWQGKQPSRHGPVVSTTMVFFYKRDEIIQESNGRLPKIPFQSFRWKVWRLHYKSFKSETFCEIYKKNKDLFHLWSGKLFLSICLPPFYLFIILSIMLSCRTKLLRFLHNPSPKTTLSFCLNNYFPHTYLPLGMELCSVSRSLSVHKY